MVAGKPGDCSVTEQSKYGRRGVSHTKSDVHRAIQNLDKGLFPNAFCKIIPDFLANDQDHCVVMHADGAGTKSSLAYLYWKETGDLSVWKGIAQDAIVMNTDDLLCVGATENILLSSTIGRNKMRIPGEVIAEIIQGTEEFLQLLSSSLVGEDIANYLYKLVTETLPCSLNPYNLLNNINASIMSKMNKIQEERPEIIQKLQQMAAVPVEKQMRQFAATGFPNR